MPWIPYKQRPANLREKLEAKIKSSDAEKIAFDYYNAQELGLINDEQFDKHIQESFSFNPIKAAKMNENVNDEQRINAIKRKCIQRQISTVSQAMEIQ